MELCSQWGARAAVCDEVNDASASWLSNILTSGFGAGSFLSSSSLNLYSGGMVFSSSPTNTPFSFFCFSSWDWKRASSASCRHCPSAQGKAWIKDPASPGMTAHRDNVLRSELWQLGFWCVCWQHATEGVQSIQRHGAALVVESGRRPVSGSLVASYSF